MEKPPINPYILIFIGVISVSTSAIFVKLSSAPAGVIAFYRLFLSALMLLPFFLTKHRKELKSISSKDYILMTVAGIFLAFHFILWFESLHYTSVASSTVLVTLQPLFAFIGTYIIYKEKITAKMIISGIVAITGSVIISWGDFNVSKIALWGDILALVACALITGYLLFGQTVRKRVTLVTYTFLVYLISAITLFFYVIVNNETLFPYPSIEWLYFFLLALLPTLLGHSLFNWSLKWISTNAISMAILFEPVGATILAYYFLEEKIVWTQIIGGTIVLFGLTIFLSKRKNTSVD
ncbi:DMT family transporter [Bacillus kwashiorkori]|uniref:DMT family transporter n=1 Tax=Bacillus kwashiorkori TaxID=1522318 RepID=UPI000783CB37|nr:DMT family transporter [Bacillus kwashiorkori]